MLTHNMTDDVLAAELTDSQITIQDFWPSGLAVWSMAPQESTDVAVSEKQEGCAPGNSVL